MPIINLDRETSEDQGVDMRYIGELSVYRSGFHKAEEKSMCF